MKSVVISASALTAILALGPSVSAPPPAAAEQKPAEAAKPSTPADIAYAAYEKVLREQPPKELSQQEQSDWWGLQFARVCNAAARFMQDFPQDPRCWKVLDVYAMYTANLEGGQRARRKKVDEQIALALKATDIEDRDWQQAKGHQISALMRPIYEAKAQGEKYDLTAVRQAIDEMAQHSPKAGALGMYEMLYTRMLQEQNLGLALAWLEHLAAGENKEVAKLAAGRLKIDQMRAQAPTMKFTSIDGREVDLEKMRGKVVLIDFWATWCGPCVAEQPNIIAAYNKYHKQGFEVVGISLDYPKDKQKLVDFVAERKLPWPQHFDEQNERNRFADEYGIIAIPTQLLLDRDGKLVHDEARGDKLNAELKRLMGS